MLNIIYNIFKKKSTEIFLQNRQKKTNPKVCLVEYIKRRYKMIPEKLKEGVKAKVATCLL